MIVVSDEVREAAAVVALETTLVAHGFPAGEGVAVGLEAERRVRAAGAVPATIGVLEGKIRVGLSKEELARFDVSARKAGPRDLAACVVQGAVGATTVGGSLAVCRAAGIRFMGTGGLGGVHRGFPIPRCLADLGELARTQALSSPPESSRCSTFCDARVPGHSACRCSAFKRTGLFYSAHGGPPVPARVESASEVARVAQAQWERGGGGLLLARPPDDSLDNVEPLIEEALAAAARNGVTGQAVTPFVLTHLHEHSGGRTLAANRDLVVANAALAAEVAVSQ